MIQTIVFAADMSVYTPYILQHVISLAEGCRAKVIAIHAVEPLGCLGNMVVNNHFAVKNSGKSSGKSNEDGLSVVLASIKDQLIDLLADEFLESNVASELSDVEVIVEAGKPADIILNHALLRNADLIVMGSHSPDAVHGYGIGSVTNKVLQLSKVPVFTVPMLPQAPSSLDTSLPPTQHPLF